MNALSKRLITVLSNNRLLLRASASRRRLFLTFDDGPHDVHTPQLLELLSYYDAKATFFMVGRDVSRFPDVARTVVSRGHELGNHSLCHFRMERISSFARHSEISAMERYLHSFDNRSEHCFRPPYGGMSLGMVLDIVASGTRVALWSRDSMDYTQDRDKVADCFARSPAVAGDILLFHDDASTATTSLEQLLPMWIKSGFTFGLLSEIYGR